MTSKFKSLEKWVLLILLFLLPSQLAYHFWPEFAFIFGIRVDYLAPAVYLSDVLLVYLLLINFKIFSKHVWFLGFILCLGIVNTLFSVLPLATLLRWIKILEVSGFAIYISRQKIVKAGDIYKTLFYSAIFFSLIGIFQFFVGSTLGDAFYIFGERSFNSNTPGIALVNLWGRSFLRAYSTFPHPNSMAGYIGIIIILSSSIKHKPVLFLTGLIVIVVGFVFSFSLTAFCAMLLVYLLFITTRKVKLIKNISLSIYGFVILLSIITPVIANLAVPFLNTFPENVYQRLDLAIVSGKLVGQRFLFGEGLNSFIFAATKIKGTISYSWLMQPVHNIYLLVLSEVGIVGLLCIAYLFYKLLFKNLVANNITLILCLIFIIVTGFADHYWLTLQQNILLLAVVFGLSLSSRNI